MGSAFPVVWQAVAEPVGACIGLYFVVSLVRRVVR